MKRNLCIAVALFATMTASAQNIAAVSPGNETTIYQTLDDAVSKAEEGSVIYLPGGGFQIKDETKITKKFTIMGVSHRGDTDNADGATIISGNLNFEGGSSGSSIIGAYVSGNINVGTVEEPVTNITIRFCNVGSIQVRHSESSGMVVNQCYLRSKCGFGYCNVRLENNVIYTAHSISGGYINHNIITSGSDYSYRRFYSLGLINNSSIINNFFIANNLDGYNCSGENCYVANNCILSGGWGEDCIVLDEEMTWDDVFVSNKGVVISSDYHFKDTWTKGVGKATDGTDIGLYGGSGFEMQHAPIPRIVSKKVAEQTDGSGRLHIEVIVKSN